MRCVVCVEFFIFGGSLLGRIQGDREPVSSLITFSPILGLIVRAPLLSRIERERIDHIKLLILSSLMLLLFLLGIAVLLRFVGPVHLSVKGKLISSTLLLLKNVSGPYTKNL